MIASRNRRRRILCQACDLAIYRRAWSALALFAMLAAIPDLFAAKPETAPVRAAGMLAPVIDDAGWGAANLDNRYLCRRNGDRLVCHRQL